MRPHINGWCIGRSETLIIEVNVLPVNPASLGSVKCRVLNRLPDNVLSIQKVRRTHNAVSVDAAILELGVRTRPLAISVRGMIVIPSLNGPNGGKADKKVGLEPLTGCLTRLSAPLDLSMVSRGRSVNLNRETRVI